MKRFIWGASAAALLGLGFSAPALAATAPTLLYVSNLTPDPSIPGDNLVTFKVSGLTLGATIIPIALSSGGHELEGPTNGTVTSQWYDGQVGTEVFTLPIAGSFRGSPITAFEVRETLYNDLVPGVGYPTYYSNQVSLNALPYGQLPEVPWAAGLPLAALGIGALLWTRRNRAAKPTPTQIV